MYFTFVVNYLRSIIGAGIGDAVGCGVGDGTGEDFLSSKISLCADFIPRGANGSLLPASNSWPFMAHRRSLIVSVVRLPGPARVRDSWAGDIPSRLARSAFVILDCLNSFKIRLNIRCFRRARK